MSKLFCLCGHTIRDQTDCLPYMARILPDEDTEKPIDLFAQAVTGLLDAHAQGPEQVRAFLIRFHVEHGDSPNAAAHWVDAFIPSNSSLESLVSTLLFPYWTRYQRILYECENCGRVWIQVEGNHFVPYAPESDRRGVLHSTFHHPPYPADDNT